MHNIFYDVFLNSQNHPAFHHMIWSVVPYFIPISSFLAILHSILFFLSLSSFSYTITSYERWHRESSETGGSHFRGTAIIYVTA